MIRVHTFLAFFFLSLSGDTPKSSIPFKTLVEANDLLRGGEYKKARPLLLTTLQDAVLKKDGFNAARARVGLAVCYIVANDFRPALEHANFALRYGVEAKDADVAVRAALNLSNIYRRMGNYASAGESLRAVNALLPEISDVALNAQIYLHLGNEAARSRDWERAEPLFFLGIDAALRNNDVQTAASGWNQLGHMRLLSNHLVESEAALTEAFRLRRSKGRRNLGTSYAYLGMLRIAQGDARSALNLLDRAVEHGWNGEAAVRLANVYFWRARAKASLGEVRGALADFEEATTRATAWRDEILSTDDDRVSFEVTLDRMYDDYVDTGMTEWLKTRDAALARRMFEVAEQHKSASFRQSLTAGKQMPVEYWAALAEYRAALSSAWRSGRSQSTNESRLKLSRVEASVGLKHALEGSGRIEEVQHSLSGEEALISFATGESQSWMWAVTRSTAAAYALPGRKQIAPVASRYRRSLEVGAARSGSNTQLYAMLFGSLPSNIQAKKDWLLSLDEGLFDVPFAALGPDNAPLILFHSLRSIFGAGLLGRARSPMTSLRFVGAGDAIYNSADSRWHGPRPANTLGFARLMGAGLEVQETSRAWTPDRKPTLLLGEGFNREALDRALQGQSGVVHIAAHVVRHHTDAKEVMIGLGLGRDGTPDFLTRYDVAAKDIRAGLVTLNGCASGTGAELPGAGLVGMSRSWLLAGATAVASTYWPVPDEPGDLFVKLYSGLAAQSKAAITAVKAARALREAQVAAWRGRSKPGASRGWAAVFLSTRS